MQRWVRSGHSKAASHRRVELGPHPKAGVVQEQGAGPVGLQNSVNSPVPHPLQWRQAWDWLPVLRQLSHQDTPYAMYANSRGSV